MLKVRVLKKRKVIPMADVHIPFTDNGRDVITTTDWRNKIKHIVKSVEFHPEPPVFLNRVRSALKSYGYGDAKVEFDGVNTIYIEISQTIVEVKGVGS